MSTNLVKYGILAIKILLAAVFVASGLSKLAGAEVMVEGFETIGLGQWFRYFTGVIEVGSAALLFTPNKQAYGAGLLVCTMIGAAVTNVYVMKDSPALAIILGVLAAIILYAHRDQIIRPALKQG